MIAYKIESGTAKGIVNMKTCYNCKADVNRVYQGYFCPCCSTEYNDYGEVLEPIY